MVQERPLPVHKSIRKLDRERTHRRNLGYLTKGSVSALGEGLEDRVLILGLVNSNLDLCTCSIFSYDKIQWNILVLRDAAAMGENMYIRSKVLEWIYMNIHITAQHSTAQHRHEWNEGPGVKEE